MKKILLLLTFIIACNFAPQCHTRPIFTGKDNLAPMIIYAAIAIGGLWCGYIGTKGIYLFIYDKLFGNKRGNRIHISYNGYISPTTNINNFANINDSNANGTYDLNLIEGNGTRETKIIQLHETFEGIIASGKAILNLHASSTNENILKITADENILEHFGPTFNNNSYTIGKTTENTKINCKPPIEYNLYLNPTTLAALESLTTSGDVKTNLGTLDLGSLNPSQNKPVFSFKTSGSSSITGGTLTAIKKLQIKCSGDSNIKDINGSAEMAQIELKGSSNLNINNLKINQTASIETEGRSKAWIKSKDITPKISGSSNIIHYKLTGGAHLFNAQNRTGKFLQD